MARLTNIVRSTKRLKVYYSSLASSSTHHSGLVSPMAPRRAKAKAAAASSTTKKRAAEESPETRLDDAPPAKKARQDASEHAPAKGPPVSDDVIELSDSDDDEGEAVPLKKTIAPIDISDDEENESDDGDSDEEQVEDRDGLKLPRKVHERLEFIHTHTDGLTSTYLRMITQQLPGRYMGKGGSNSDVAVDIANHCSMQAQRGVSDLGFEKRLVKRVHRMCWGACGESDDSDDEYDDDYEVPKVVLSRLSYCLGMLDVFSLESLRKVMKALPKYKGWRKGEHEKIVDAILAHMEDSAAKKSDLVAEVEMVERIKKENSVESVQ
ncbi:hypothetical protein C8J57DRAFT_1715190 [Mycena rebaudengoi]|nr:hypothetical protein C8J57DRAFT_1715190 [Mycena rebaudengoi]